MPPHGATMRAVVRAGMAFNPAAPVPLTPKAGSEDILVRVKGAGFNPIDYKLPKAVASTNVGLDFAGVIEAVASGSPKHGFKVGDEVYGAADGSFADLVIANGLKVAHKPKTASWTDTGSLPTAYLTGLQALTTHGDLKKGGRVLILGASGGCGLAGVQIARSLGAELIVGVCSARNKEVVTHWGAHRVVDYNTENIANLFGSLPDAEKFDCVYDCATGSGAGESYEADSWRVLKPTGHYVAINGSPWNWIRFFLGCHVSRKHLFVADMNRKDLETMARFIEEKTLSPVIAKVFPLTKEGWDGAYAMLKSRRTVGKIVFDMEAKDEAKEEAK